MLKEVLYINGCIISFARRPAMNIISRGFELKDMLPMNNVK